MGTVHWVNEHRLRNEGGECRGLKYRKPVSEACFNEIAIDSTFLNRHEDRMMTIRQATSKIEEKRRKFGIEFLTSHGSTINILFQNCIWEGRSLEIVKKDRQRGLQGRSESTIYAWQTGGAISACQRVMGPGAVSATFDQDLHDNAPSLRPWSNQMLCTSYCQLQPPLRFNPSSLFLSFILPSSCCLTLSSFSPTNLVLFLLLSFESSQPPAFASLESVIADFFAACKRNSLFDVPILPEFRHMTVAQLAIKKFPIRSKNSSSRFCP